MQRGIINSNKKVKSIAHYWNRGSTLHVASSASSSQSSSWFSCTCFSFLPNKRFKNSVRNWGKFNSYNDCFRIYMLYYALSGIIRVLRRRRRQRKRGQQDGEGEVRVWLLWVIIKVSMYSPKTIAQFLMVLSERERKGVVKVQLWYINDVGILLLLI